MQKTLNSQKAHILHSAHSVFYCETRVFCAFELFLVANEFRTSEKINVESEYLEKMQICHLPACSTCWGAVGGVAGSHLCDCRHLESVAG